MLPPTTRAFRKLFSWALALLTSVAVPDARSSETEPSLKLTFGVYASDKPTTMYRQFKPAALYLEEYLASALSVTVRIKLRIFRSYDSARQALVDGQVDFVRFGPASYILAEDIARERGQELNLVAVEADGGDYRFDGVIFTRADTGINALSDLKGKRFAFGDPTSTIGRYLSQARLVEAGIHASDLQYEYLERHDLVVTAVLAGKFDAGAAKEGTFAKFKDQGLKELCRFENVSKPWIARSGLDQTTINALRSGLLGLSDKNVLKAIDSKATGFGAPGVDGAPDAAGYDFVRKGMEAAKKFGG